jgi:hypothetical protein
VPTKIIKNRGTILKTIIVNLNDNYRQLEDNFCFCSNEMQQSRIWRAKQNEYLLTTT